MSNTEIQKNYPKINTNTFWEKIYNPDFSKYFGSLNSKNYLDLAKKLAKENSQIFRHIYIEHNDGEIEDLMQDWALSCASFITNVLKYYKLITDSSARVKSAEQRIKEASRTEVKFNEEDEEIENIPKWAILIRANKRKWERDEFFVADFHLWFYLGNGKAISNVVTDKLKKIKAIAIHNAIRDAPKFDHYDKIEVVKYYLPPQKVLDTLKNYE